jgi:hypothetical protein
MAFESVFLTLVYIMVWGSSSPWTPHHRIVLQPDGAFEAWSYGQKERYY